MISTRKENQQNIRLLSQLDDFDEDFITGEAATSGQQNVVVNDSTVDREVAVSNSGSISTTNENTVKVQTLERCFNERIDWEMGNIVDTVEDKIQNANLTAVDNIITPRIELAVRSINAPSGRNAASLTSNSERGERIGITASFANVSERNNTFHELNANDETRENIPDEVKKLSVPGTHFDRQPHTHHRLVVRSVHATVAYKQTLLICIIQAINNSTTKVCGTLAFFGKGKNGY